MASIVNNLLVTTGSEPGGSGQPPTNREKWADSYIMDNFDLNNNGSLSADEEEAANKFLDKYDKDGNDDLSDDEIDVMMYDKNNNGELSTEEDAYRIEFAAEGSEPLGPALDQYDMYSYFGSEDKFIEAGGNPDEDYGGIYDHTGSNSNGGNDDSSDSSDSNNSGNNSSGSSSGNNSSSGNDSSSSGSGNNTNYNYTFSIDDIITMVEEILGGSSYYGVDVDTVVDPPADQ